MRIPFDLNVTAFTLMTIQYAGFAKRTERCLHNNGIVCMGDLLKDGLNIPKMVENSKQAGPKVLTDIYTTMLNCYVGCLNYEQEDKFVRRLKELNGERLITEWAMPLIQKEVEE